MDATVAIRTSIDIDADPDIVWPHLVDWENLGRWMTEGTNFFVTSPERTGIGVTAEATIKIGGISTKDAIRVTSWEPPHKLEISHLGWVSGTGKMECIPRPGGTRLVWEERLLPPLGILGVIGMRIMLPVIRRIFLRDLTLLKQLVEAG